MTRKIVPIVEGDGEVRAVPTLLHKVMHHHQRYDLQVAPPKNAHGKGALTRPGGIERFLELAYREPGCVGVLVMLDADDDCPLELARRLSSRAAQARFPTVFVVPCRIYETWFLACAETLSGCDLDGRPGLQLGLYAPEEVEQASGPKNWLSNKMPEGRSYKETEDQLCLTRPIDIEQAYKRSRSFRRLMHAVEELLQAVDEQRILVTPT